MSIPIIYDYEYESNDFYCYPNTKILRNKLNIKNNKQLNIAEREITSLKIAKLLVEPIKGKFDLRHLQKIHYDMFCDVYEWAGQLRIVNISKGNMFCNTKYIESYANEIFTRLKQDNYLKDIPFEKLSGSLSYYLGEINALHPFREGNGRTQRIFIEYLVENLGYKIDFTTVTATEMIEASILSFAKEYEKMNKMFQRILNKK